MAGPVCRSAEKATKQVASHVTEYRGEKPPGDWPQEFRGEKPPEGWPHEYRGEKPLGDWRQKHREEKPPGDWRQEYRGEKPPGDWRQKHRGEKPPGDRRQEYRGEKPPGDRRQEYRGEKPPGDRRQEYRGEKSPGGLRQEYRGEKPPGEKTPRQDSGCGRGEKEAVLGTGETKQERLTAGTEGAASCSTSGDRKQGVITFGGKGSEPGKFSYPRGVVVSPSNEIFVADKLNRRVQVHSTEGVYLRHFQTVVSSTGDKVMEPHDVCMDAMGRLWVVGREETADHVVQYSTDGAAMAEIGLEKNYYAREFAMDMRTNYILVTDIDQGAVQVFRPGGSLVRIVRHPRGKMTRPRYITVDGEGNILVSDYRSNCVYVYDESGKILFQFSGQGRGMNKLNCPRGICTDRAGNIIVANSKNSRVQIFTRHGKYVRTVRTRPGLEGLAVGPGGQLVVTNRFENNVTVFPNY
ncbi:uncharacterized protein LOC144867447 [Branchiostoma floridae x Branchiostoma japonicum]